MTFDDLPPDDDYNDAELFDDGAAHRNSGARQRRSRTVYRREGGDPLFGLLIAGAVSLGLMPLVGSGAADLRYTLTWGMLAGFGVIAWLLGSVPRIEQERPDNLAWGIAFGLILGVPILAFGGATLNEAAELMFRDMTTGTVLAYVVFVMPLGETLFFRNILQKGRAFWTVALITTVWQMVLFFPLINRQAFPLLVGVIMLMANLMYSYVRERNDLAAAWLCQIVVNILVLFLPFAGII